jgi:hypothetical protein
MSNRIVRSSKPELVTAVNRFFLACELKPHSRLWSVIDPFAYDVKPAFIYGVMGATNYQPDSYSILEVQTNTEPLLGYLATITEPDTVLLLDKLKGYNGPNVFNVHTKQLTHVYTDVDTIVTAWCYVLSRAVLETYKEIQQVEFGMWSEDKSQMALLDKITKPTDLD